MEMVLKRKTAEAWKKKNWFTIVAPRMFEEKEAGSTLAESPEKLVNRVLEVPLAEITHNIPHQFVKLHLRVTQAMGKDAHTEFDGFELVREYVRRNIRRGRTLITVVHEVRSKEGRRLQLTVQAFTAQKVRSSVKDEARKRLVLALEKGCSNEAFDQLVQKLVFGTISAELSRAVKEVVPLRRIEISKCEVLHD